MNLIGIDLDGETIKLAVLSKKKGLIDLKSFEIKDLSALHSLLGKKDTTVSGLSIQDVLIKNIPIKIKIKNSLSNAIKFQDEFISNIDPEKTLSFSLILKKDSLLKFFITTKDLLKKHLNRLLDFKIDPDYVTCHAMALCQFAMHFFNETKDAFLVHIAQNKTYCILMKNNMPEKSFAIKIGKKDLILENKKQLSKTDIFSLKENSKLLKILTHLKNEIKNTFISFTNERKYPLILTGNTQNFLNLDKFLENEKTTISLTNEEDNKTKNYAISIGLALCVFKKDEKIGQFGDGQSKIVQFRNEQFSSQKKILNIGKKITFFCFTILLLMSIFYFISSSSLKTKKKKLHENLITLENFEKKELNERGNIHITNLFDDLKSYEKKLFKQKKEFPYFLKAPNVSQTLAWLNSHKLLKNAEILSFNYALQKYPDITHKKSPYLTKIEIKFTTDTPSTARSFYDSLIKGEGLVNSEKKITWEVKNSSYKTSFYLKPTNPFK